MNRMDGISQTISSENENENEKRKPSDPRTALYFYPSIPAVRLQKMWQEWHKYNMLELAVKMSAQAHRKLVHRSFLSRQKRFKFADRQVKIGHEVYYSLSDSEMSKRALERALERDQEETVIR